jgi:hypothetical protein
VAEVFDWHTAGDIVVPTATSEMTFRVSAPSAAHLRGLTGEVGTMLTGRWTFEKAEGWAGQHPWGIPAFVLTHGVPGGWLVPARPSTSSPTGSKAPWPRRPLLP